MFHVEQAGRKFTMFHVEQARRRFEITPLRHRRPTVATANDIR
jgi:hypothetical protein